MSDLLLTKTGLPNSCCKCGKAQKTAWYAIHDDMARSGQGVCSSCAGIKGKKRPKSVPQPEAKPPEPEALPEPKEEFSVELPLEEAALEDQQA